MSYVVPNTMEGPMQVSVEKKHHARRDTEFLKLTCSLNGQYSAKRMAGHAVRISLTFGKDFPGVFGTNPINNSENVFVVRQLAQDSWAVDRDECGRNLARQCFAQ